MRLIRWIAPALGATLLIGLASCSNNHPAVSTRMHRPRMGPGEFAPPPDTSNPVASTAPAPIAVKSVTWDGYQDTIKSLKGKVVVVDFWQTT